MGDASMTSNSFFSINSVPRVPQDVLYALVEAYEADQSHQKVDLGAGAYRDDNARPWILPSIRKAEKMLYEDPKSNHEYTPIAGVSGFAASAQKLILGKSSPAILTNRVSSFQAISGTGALHMGATFLSKFSPKPAPSIYISSPSWPAHDQVFTNVGLSVKHYPYIRRETMQLDFDGMISTIQSAPAGSVILLHACAHNPTGIDPSPDQWRQLAQVIRSKNHLSFFDSAYQGFASGSLDTDSFAIRHFVELGMEIMIAQSFAKNMGLYGQRVGAFHYVAAPGDDAMDLVKNVTSQMAVIQRSEISSPPIYGAALATIVMNDETLFEQWREDLRTMSGRIMEMRKALKGELDRLGTPGNWNHIVDQIGMFSFTGLSVAQVRELKTKWHVYMLETGRISVAGLNSHSVEYFAKAIDDVVRRVH